MRRRSGPLSVVVRLDPDRTRPAVGFAIPRRVGTAVTRNRLRRRLREVLRTLCAAGRLPAGEYLVVLSPGVTDEEPAALRDRLEQLVTRPGEAA